MNTLGISQGEAFFFVLAMGAVILLCRAFPFLFFRRGASGTRKAAFINFVERTVPPAAMTVLTFNILGGAFRDYPGDGLLVLAASVLTALLHLWKRNALISIFGGTVLYMVLIRVI